MGTFSVSGNSSSIPQLRQFVYLNGALRSDIFCLSITRNSGVNGTTCDLQIPSLTWDGGKADLRGAFIQVYAGYDTPVQLFNGYITSVSGDAGNNYLALQASSIMALSQTCYVGESNGYSVKYPEYSTRNGIRTKTNWTIAEILRDIISTSSNPKWRGGGGGISSTWRARLKLGALGLFNSTTNRFPIGDIAFENTTLADALNQLLGIVGTISFYEEFQGYNTYLRFYELADPKSPVKVIRVARANECAANTNVISISNDETLDDIRTKFVGVGDYKKYIVTAFSDHATAPLVKGWNTSLQAAVLSNPEIGKKGNQSGQADDLRGEYAEQYANVFRKFYLPDVLRRRLIDSENAIDTADGSKLPIQVFTYPNVKTFNAANNSWTGVVGSVPVLVDGTEFKLDEGYFILKEPAIDITSSTLVDDVPVDVYAPIKVGITLTVNDDKLTHSTADDSSIVNMEFPLQENVFNDSFKFAQAGVTGLRDGNDATHNFVALVRDDTGWTEFQSIVLADDTNKLRYYTENAKREKNRVRIGYSIQTPYFTNAYNLGDRIEVIGQADYQYGTHQIANISYNLTNDHSTAFSTDNSVPLIANTLLGA